MLIHVVHREVGTSGNGIGTFKWLVAFFPPLLQVTAKLRYREQSEAGMLYEFLLGNVVRCLRLGGNFGQQMHGRAAPWPAIELNVGRLH